MKYLRDSFSWISENESEWEKNPIDIAVCKKIKYYCQN